MRLIGRPRGLAVSLTASLAAALLLTGCGGVGSTGDQLAAQDAASADGSAGPFADRTSPAGDGLTWATDETGNVDVRGRFFAADSPWNQRVDTDPVDPDSGRLLGLAAERVGVIEQPGNLPPILERRIVTDGLFINTTRWTTPIVADGPATRVVCRQADCGDPIAQDTLPIPEAQDPDPEYDGWFTVLEGDTAYDLWRARREGDGSISYHFARAWDLRGPGFNAPQTVSARGSGLPLFAGLISRDELSTGRIEHALAIALPGPAQRSFVQPASATDGNGRLRSLPLGARIRLRADTSWVSPVDDKGKPLPMTAQQRRLADGLVVALRRYGAIVVERAAVPTLYAQRDVVADLIVGNELQGFTLDDFEVLQLGERHAYPPHDEDPARTVTNPAATNPTDTASKGTP